MENKKLIRENMKNKIAEVLFNNKPIVCIRDISPNENTELTKNKKDYPFILCRDVIVTVFTTDFKFSFKIPKKYVWNGADIPRSLWALVGASKDNDFLKASLVHDFMLQHKQFIYYEVLDERVSVSEFRRLSSLIFRQILKDCDVNCIKSNVMSWFVQSFQSTFNRKAWLF